MKNLPANLILEKNKLDTTSVWLILLDILLNDEAETVIRLVLNNEDFSYNGNTYAAFNFTLDPMKQDSQGAIPTLTLKVSNITHLLQPYLGELQGGIGSLVKITIVNNELPEEVYSELEMEFNVLATNSNAEWVTFTLGSTNPLRKRFPLYRYVGLHCRWKYKSISCGYGGELPTCDKTLVDCRTHENSERFGGFPAMRSKSVRVI